MTDWRSMKNLMSLRLGLVMVATLAVVATSPASEPPGAADTVAWLHGLVREGDLSHIHTVSAQAHVTVSDGMEYDVTTHYRNPQRAAFRSVYPDRRITLGIDGHYIWIFDGQEERQGQAGHGVFVLGHQFHAALLFFPVVNGADPTAAPRRDPECECMVQQFASDSGEAYVFRYDEDSMLPISSTTVLKDGPTIQLTYHDWQAVDGVRLPHHIKIDDGERVFDYRFTQIRFNQDERASLRAPDDALTARQKLMRRHIESMDAHLASDASLMQDHWAEQVVIVSNGGIHVQSGADAAAFMTRSLGSRRHSVYDDLELPHIEISGDGTLGSLTARVRAVGERVGNEGQPGAAFQFVSAWTSIFRNDSGAWKLISNTSNFEPVDP